MNSPAFRLYFIDVMRAFAICMMLQGHFVDGLLADTFREEGNLGYLIWKYFRGITAPTFFTVSGFIFTYLLIKEKAELGWKNPRVKKGIRRGLMLIGLGYFLRLNLGGLLIGEVYDGFFMVDVLQCIGLSILFIISIYLHSFSRKKYVLPLLLAGGTFVIFLAEPLYANLHYNFLPKLFANYFTKANGSIFTIFPWFGYASFGGFMGVLFHTYKDRIYCYRYAIILSLSIGLALMLLTTPLLWKVYELYKNPFTLSILRNDYLFIRLGNVLVLFTLFMLLRNSITAATIRAIGQNTLSIYVFHFVLLYGSLTGLGLYKFFNHSLPPVIIIPGALLFVAVTIYLSFQYNRYKPFFINKITVVQQEMLLTTTGIYDEAQRFLTKLKTKIASIFSFVKS